MTGRQERIGQDESVGIGTRREEGTGRDRRELDKTGGRKGERESDTAPKRRHILKVAESAGSLSNVRRLRSILVLY